MYNYLKKYQGTWIFNVILGAIFISTPFLYIYTVIQEGVKALEGDFTKVYKGLFKAYRDGEVK